MRLSSGLLHVHACVGVHSQPITPCIAIHFCVITHHWSSLCTMTLQGACATTNSLTEPRPSRPSIVLHSEHVTRVRQKAMPHLNTV